MSSESQEPTPRWRERVAALKNIPPVLRMVWEAAPKVIVASLFCRVTAALVPLAVLAVTRVIINDIYELKFILILFTFIIKGAFNIYTIKCMLTSYWCV